MGKDITTQTTVENLTAELKKKFTGYDADIAAVKESAAAVETTVGNIEILLKTI